MSFLQPSLSGPAWACPHATSLRWAMVNAPKDEWGPPRWRWLTTAAIRYPGDPSEEEAVAMLRMIWALVDQLPCEECRVHSIIYLREHPPDLRDSYSLQRWVWAYHNDVNLRTGKEAYSFEAYERDYAEELGWSRVLDY